MFNQCPLKTLAAYKIIDQSLMCCLGVSDNGSKREKIFFQRHITIVDFKQQIIKAI